MGRTGVQLQSSYILSVGKLPMVGNQMRYAPQLLQSQGSWPFMDDKCPVGKALSADLHMALSELWQGEARSSWARGRGKKGHFIKKNRDELII